MNDWVKAIKDWVEVWGESRRRRFQCAVSDRRAALYPIRIKAAFLKTWRLTMPRRFVLIVAALITWLAFSSVAAPQSTPGISVSPGTHISSDSPNAPFVETFLAINPVDPQNLIAASIVGTNGSTGSRVYASRDGGHALHQGRITTGQLSLCSLFASRKSRDAVRMVGNTTDRGVRIAIFTTFYVFLPPIDTGTVPFKYVS